ncbi:DUF362 domain-containing protein [Natronolimnobius sp. AArcel1]|uniref:DUF362 domain-containing protein n=1 Tax=Natronolimnobius sp. AArcel1 TaxID=1679093 RepID=UPI0013EAFE70|nr:DUF362 domain-containing protein [Natronolimnobius sp. AArcel1]NGM71244.1 DUF362 domain-containing protein [Natronolimnobius sp. AArcel1]
MAQHTVRGATTDADDRRGGWTPDIDTRLARLESPVRAVVDATLSSLTRSEPDQITIVPDIHYPFHPSTGMVSDPAVVGSLIGQFEDRTDADIAVAGATDEIIDVDRTAEYLGYPRLLERFDATTVDLADEQRTEAQREVDGWSTTVSVPDRLLESAVITVPTLRPTEAGPIAGGVRTLAEFVDSSGDDALAAVAATRAIDPPVSILDATVAYGSDPYAADALFAGATPAVDALGTSLLGRSITDDDVLSTAVGMTDNDKALSLSLEHVGPGDDVNLDAIRTRLEGGELPPTGDMHPAVTAAYRLYAGVSGDAVPPQLEH